MIELEGYYTMQVTPMAPELGLFLDECVFKSYNDRWGNDREAQVALSDFQEQVDAFKVRATSKKHATSAMIGPVYCAARLS